MEEKPWTPGPWKWEKDKLDDYQQLKSETPQPNLFSKGGFLYPTVLRVDDRPAGYKLEEIISKYTGWETWVDVEEADADLIAAAPDLYDALEECAEVLQKYVALHRSGTTEAESIKASVSKATAALNAAWPGRGK